PAVARSSSRAVACLPPATARSSLCAVADPAAPGPSSRAVADPAAPGPSSRAVACLLTVPLSWPPIGLVGKRPFPGSAQLPHSSISSP
ncbi:MAG: hypothetical protein GY805_03780, partial [Chloroflexi bacterium]|nr:hypothetical protein [Chloroflexota bacterium]